MALTADWSSLSSPLVIRTFTGGHATDWCVHTLPTWARTVEVRNNGTGLAYVSIPSQTGAWGATDNAIPIAAGSSRRFVLSPGGKSTIREIATFGADGAAHPMSIVFSAHVD